MKNAISTELKSDMTTSWKWEKSSLE